MATITTPAKGFTGSVVGVDFKDGVGETESPTALEYFERQGYTIEAAPEAVEPDFPEGAPVEAWTKAQLTAWATANEIDLGKAKTKDEILAVVAPAKVELADGSTPKIGDDGIPVVPTGE